MITVTVFDEAANIGDNPAIGFISTFPSRPTAMFESDDLTTMEIDVSELTFYGTTKEKIKSHIDTYGMHVGVPCQITDGTINLDYIIDLTQDAEFNDYYIKAKIMRFKGKDHFFKVADATTFQSIVDEGTTFNTFDAYYEIIREDQAAQALTIFATEFVTAMQAAQAVSNVAKQVAAFTAALDVSPSHAVAAGIVLAADIVYAGVLLTAVVVMGFKFKEAVFPSRRTFKVCTFIELLSKSCTHLGFGFKSTLLESVSGATYLPVPIIKDRKGIFKVLDNLLTKSFTKGYPTNECGGFQYVGVFFRACEILFNAKTKVINGVVRLERRDYFDSGSVVAVQSSMTNQSNRSTSFKRNTDDAWKRLFIEYQTDPLDFHTMDNFNPTTSENGAENILSLGKEYDLLKGYKKASIPFSLGTRKDDYSFVEEQCLKLFNFMDEHFDTNFSNAIEKRIGDLIISQQFFSTPKVLYLDSGTGQQPSNYLDYIGADAIKAKYYGIEAIVNNSYQIFENMPIPMSMADYQKTVDTEVLNIDGVDCKITSMRYISDESEVNVSFWKPEDWATNKINTFAL